MGPKVRRAAQQTVKQLLLVKNAALPKGRARRVGCVSVVLEARLTVRQ